MVPAAVELLKSNKIEGLIGALAGTEQGSKLGKKAGAVSGRWMPGGFFTHAKGGATRPRGEPRKHSRRVLLLVWLMVGALQFKLSPYSSNRVAREIFQKISLVLGQVAASAGSDGNAAKISEAHLAIKIARSGGRNNENRLLTSSLSRHRHLSSYSP